MKEGKPMEVGSPPSKMTTVIELEPVKVEQEAEIPSVPDDTAKPLPPKEEEKNPQPPYLVRLARL